MKSKENKWSTEEGDSMLIEKNNVKIISETDNFEQNSKCGSSKKGIWAQCLITGAVMLSTAACGMPIGYSAILLPQLEATNGTLHIDEETGSWIASIHSAATPLGALVSGFMMDRWGRKLTLQLSVLPLIVGWTIIAAAGNHACLMVGRLIAGSSVGITAAPGSVLIAEISEPRVRGIFTSIPFASYAFGILLVYALGSVLHWRLVAGISTILPILAVLVLFFLPESPVWLVRKGCTKEAMKALLWLRGGNSIQAKRETDQLVARIENENSQQSQQIPQSTWKMLFKPQMLKPFIIINVYNLFQVVSGTYIVVFYAVDIIAQIGDSSIDKFLAAVLTSGVRFLFSIVASILLAIIGRRTLALTSGVGTAIAALTLGGYLYLIDTNEASYIPAILVLLYVAANTVGYMILPTVMLGEVYPARTRGLGGGLTFMIFNIAIFGSTKIFPLIKHCLGVHGVFLLFGGCSLVACVFLYAFLPETKGRTLNEIEDYFLENNTMWINRDKEWGRQHMKNNHQAV